MRIGRVLYLIGKISLILGASMLLPLITSLIYPDGDFAAFALSRYRQVPLFMRT